MKGKYLFLQIRKINLIKAIDVFQMFLYTFTKKLQFIDMINFELGGTQVTGSVSITKQFTAAFTFCDKAVGKIALRTASSYKSDNTTVLKLELDFKADPMGKNDLSLDLTKIGVSGITADAVEMVVYGRPKPDPRIIVVARIPM